MNGFLIGLAVLVALGWVAGRRAIRWLERRQRTHAPGMSADRPLKIASFQEMDDAVDSWRCLCGGSLELLGEGGRPGMRVARCRCMSCEEEVDLFFDLSELRN